jgi:hypothetical protein
MARFPFSLSKVHGGSTFPITNRTLTRSRRRPVGRRRVRGARHRVQRRVVGAGRASWLAAGTERGWAAPVSRETIRERGVRQYRQNLGVLRRDAGLGGGGRAGGPCGLGARRRLGSEYRAAAFVHRDCVASA